ncbi:MAG: hypothetical protein NTW28_32355 [Candidatus Solibacter sp.]|nr:hypothetical protein [Candidatus Solibacter sp.]
MAQVEMMLAGWSPRQREQSAPTLANLPARLPRITRLMALAIKFQDMVNRGEVRDYADLARLGYVTRARLTQIMNLLLLAPDIQEAILDNSNDWRARSAITERDLRRVSRTIDWAAQRQMLDGTNRFNES